MVQDCNNAVHEAWTVILISMCVHPVPKRYLRASSCMCRCQGTCASPLPQVAVDYAYFGARDPQSNDQADAALIRDTFYM